MENTEDRERSLQDEAAKRAEWRGDDNKAPKPKREGNTLPASEDQDERMGGGSGEGGNPPRPLATMLPPD